ncbi:hypothetical protein NT6N_35390 [Oceaniferula spumae]|uniref:NolW-like domain-containing protein n=1 Tax=Oceaniferula spumae TaxID=2979115 RepID=A0AAT9FR71_9BACT
MKYTIAIMLGGLFLSSMTMAQDVPESAVKVTPAQPGPDGVARPGEGGPAGVDPSRGGPQDESPAGPGAAGPIDPGPGARGDDLPADRPDVLPGDAPADADPEVPAADPAAQAGEAKSIEAEDGGFLIKDANINDIFQLLARRAGKQYFHNNKLNSDEYKVTGHLNGDGSSLKQMEELAFQYGLRMYVKGNTVYAMMDAQLERLPAKEWTYSLRYLRPTDIEQIKALIQPLLTAGRGIVNYEPKTNTIVVIDTMHHIEQIERVLNKIDRPKGQIVVEVKILRVNSSAGHRSGVDWSSSLGSKGVPVDVIRSLGSVFGLPSTFEGSAISGGAVAGATESAEADTSNIILTPFQLSGVLRALNEGSLVTQKSNPVVITEDNEKAIISLIDRVPIITSTVNNTGNGASTTTDEVRYKIDQSDSTDPDKTREIGVTISLTPSLLPDGTIRMNMRPRNAQIVENITGPSGNVYPRVSEATIESIARIPNGHSLIVGGFYGETKGNDKSKVPLLGDIPIFNFFFKSKQTSKEQSSLVFVVTPTSYDPSCVTSNRRTTQRVRHNTAVYRDHDSVNPKNPGPAHEPNLRRTINGARSLTCPDDYPQGYPQR